MHSVLFFCASISSSIDIMITRSYVLQTVFDPPFKVQFLNDKAHGKTELLDELFQHQSLHTTNVETLDEAGHFGCPGDEVHGGRSEDDFQEIASSYEEANSPMTIPKKDIAAKSAREVELYLRASLLERNKCPLQYWKQEEKFPLLK